MITEPTPTGRKRLRLHSNPSWKSSDLQADLHGELFSLDRLEEYAQALATDHKAITRRVPAKPLLANAEESGRILADVYSQLSGEANHEYVLMPGEEWLMDNYHVVRDTVAEVHVDLPRGYYLQLPRLAEGTWTGYPRVYAAVRELLLHTDGIVNVTNVEAFIRGYQAALPLNLGELWAVPAMLRLALVRNLAYMAQALLDAHRQMESANRWAERIVAMVEAKASSPGDTIQVPPELLHDTEQLTPTFVVRLLQNVRDTGPAVESVLTWLERELRRAGTTPEEAVRTEFTKHSALQASVGNTITSMRRVSDTNWADFVEAHSALEALLHTDPAGVYPYMDFATRDRYRRVVERVARRAGKPELDVARQALQFASESKDASPEDARRSHVGYYLAARGVHRLREAVGYKSRLGETLSRFVRAYPTTIYTGSILAFTLVLLAFAYVLGFSDDLRPAWPLLVLSGVLALFPASELASSAVNLVVTLLLPPRVLPKLDLSIGIPAYLSTFVVIPTIFKNPDDVLPFLDHIEVLYLANQDPNLRFAILSDFADAPQEEMPGDTELLQFAYEAISGLNAKYGVSDRFYLFHRKRQWNPRENAWMGWERKRGKLSDFNALLRGTGGDSFTTRVGDLSGLPQIRYVITLDSDTDLPRDAARKLVGTIAHPLNRAELHPTTQTVVNGYGILQPRVEATWDSAGKTPFARISAGHTGVDPYTTAVSNVYQDLFGEGAFIGKGIYDVDAFEAATRDRFPKNAILSHDLLEGTYARVGLVTDIELFEDIPSRYNVFAARAHRWVRGDWQISDWLFPRVPTASNRAPNPITLINRWKILDNLRRSLVPPAAVLLLLLAWLVAPLHALLWTIAIVLVFAFPLYSHLLTALPRKPRGTPWGRHLSAVFEDAATNFQQLLLTLTFLAHRAYLMLDAIVRTLVRKHITHRLLLQWLTASESQRTLGNAPTDFLKRMWQAPLFALVTALAVLAWRLESAPVAAPFLIAWALSPLVAYLVSKPTKPVVYQMTEADKHYLRRVARKTWRYFEEFVGDKDRWLAPDNFQESPGGILAHRTSPTNLSLLLLSTLSAYDLGYITLSEMLARLDRSLLSMEGLERYNGHFYNWYDTLTGQPLPPKYISTVDSGNLAGHLVTLKNGCLETLDMPLFSPLLLQNLRDLIELIRSEVAGLAAERKGPLQTGQLSTLDAIISRTEAISVLLQPTPRSVIDWVALTSSLVEPTVDLATVVRRLVGGRGWERVADETGTPPHSISSVEELSAWADSLARAVRALEQDIGNLVPWATMLEAPPALMTGAEHPDIASHWASLKKLHAPVPSLSANLAWCTHTLAEIRRLRSRVRSASLGEEGASAIRWLERFSQRVSASWVACETLQTRLTGLAQRVNVLSDEMKFGFLYDDVRKLFSIGFNMDELRRDNSYYDLLASEARLASFLAVARGDVPQAHWFRLGRPITGQGRNMALISWTGTMFEYLMPNLVMPTYTGSLLEQTCDAMTLYQEHYGKQHAVPWGISESAYNALDQSGNYRYRAFGLAELGLKRGLSDDLVISPYSSQLALPIATQKALANLRRLSSLGLEGHYGFYDAIDFTRSRLTPDQKGAVVATYMVHHLGMGLVATNNYLNGDPMVRRFEAEPEVRATLLLLQERVPREAPEIEPHPPPVDRDRNWHEETPPIVRNYSTPNTDVARGHLLSNGRYTVMITNSGAGFSRWAVGAGGGSNAQAITRWRDDAIRDSYGTFIYIRDLQNGSVWSAAAAPFDGQPTDYNARFDLEKAEFYRRDGDVETRLEIVVSPEDDAEVRRVTLTNRGSRARRLELTSYAEIALATQSADEAHPAFSKLFVETEYYPNHGSLLASRRPRSSSEKRNWAVHVVAVARQNGNTTGMLGTPHPEEYETDRMAFLGRGGSPALPRAMMSGQRLSNTQGAVLDPIFSLRQQVRVEPGMRVQISFVTAAAETREDALALSDKYHDSIWAERAVRMAATQGRLELSMLDLSVDESMQYQRIFSRMIYPQRSTRPSEATLAKNTKGQQGLWAYAISGDLPIFLVRIADPLEAPLVRQALRAHEFWLRNGFEADLVILNEYPGGYIQPVQDELEKMVGASHAHQMMNKPGGVYVKRADTMPEADRILLNSVARVVLVGSRGSLDAQLDREMPENPPPPLLLRAGTDQTRRRTGTQRSQLQVMPPSSPPSLPQSTFSPDGREYIITLEDGAWTPLPWSNVLANESFGCLVTESGMSSTWSLNSHENRLTPWSNDPVSDPPAEAIYIRDEQNGHVMCPTPLPIRDPDPYTVTHGHGYTVYSHTSRDIEQTLRVSVGIEDPVKVCKLTLHNRSASPRKLSATYYAELIMGVSRETSSRFIISKADRKAGGLFAHNPYNNEFAERVAFVVTSEATFAFTADRGEFIGRNRSTGDPIALKRRTLSGRSGAGLDPCFALQCLVDLKPGEERSITFTLGEGDNAEHAGVLAAKYRDPARVETEYNATVQMWDKLLSTVEIHTPDKGMNVLMNRWLLYQSVACRIWGRTAFYQSGGAYGFRDQLQDVMALVYAAPAIAREQILRSAGRQFKEGDVQHWWHPPTGRGVRTRFSDDLLWLPFVTAYYVEATGDTQILDEKLPYLQAPLLAPGQEDMYGTPIVTGEMGTVYEHCLRAIEHGTTAGAHGLPLMGTGDWNDGMNRVGIEGKGESVWVGWFLYAVLGAFSPLCEQRGDTDRTNSLRAEMSRLKDALETHAWDGQWYIRAFYDNGEPLGSARSEECKIDSIAQSWGVISGAADKERAAQAMQAVDECLVKKNMIELFTPPFDKTAQDPGYIKGYLPGVRENGGQYTHAAIWTAVARVLMGDGDKAYSLFKILNPLTHTSTLDNASLYMVEPYVEVADIYSHPQHIGRGGWTWYTGSASWIYRLGVEYMLGLKLHGDHFTVEPCIPSNWPGYTMTYRHGETTYKIAVENKEGGTCQVASVELDGTAAPNCKISLTNDGKEHHVRVVLVSGAVKVSVAVTK